MAGGDGQIRDVQAGNGIEIGFGISRSGTTIALCMTQFIGNLC